MADDKDKDDLDEREDDDESTSSDDLSASADSGLDDDSTDEPGLDDERIARREAADIEREERELAEGSEHDVAPISGMLGVERWVQFAFIALAVATFYIADQLMTFGWSFFAEPDSTMVSGIAALIGIGGAFALYRHPRVYQLAHEVVSELSKVTWPSKDETYYSTLVVIVTSVIAALYCGVFDAVWSSFTDLVYNV